MTQQVICDTYQIGATSSTMFPLSWYRIPIPNRAPYTPYGVSKVCGNMDSKGYGFPTAVWHFTNMSQSQMQHIFSFFTNEGDASAKVYIRTFKDIGGARESANFYVTMYRPVDGAGAQIMADSAFHWANVQVRFAHLVEQ